MNEVKKLLIYKKKQQAATEIQDTKLYKLKLMKKN